MIREVVIILRNKAVTTNPSPGIGFGGEKRNKNKGNISKPRKKPNTNNNNNDNSLNFQNDIDNNKRIIGIDPGRKNIAYCVELDPKTKKIIKKTKLTAKQYYCDSGFIRYKKKVQIWLSEEKYKRINEGLSKAILEEDSFQKYLKVYVENFDIIWESKSCKKVEKE